MSVEIRGTLHFLQSENQRLQEENQRLRDEVVRLRLVLRSLRTLQEISLGINKHTDVLGLLDRILQSALTTINASDGSLMLVDDETDELVFVVVHGTMRTQLTGYRIPLGTGIAGWAAKHAEAVMVPDVHRDPRFSSQIDQKFHFRTRSMICVPIAYDKKVTGVIQVLNKSNGEEFNEADLMLLGVVAQVAATAIHKAEAAVAEDE